MRPQKPKVHFASDAATQLKVLGSGLSLLIAVYLATNRALAGWRFLLAVILTACAIILLVEAFHRFRERDRWRLIGSGGLGLAMVALLVALVPSHPSASAAGAGLRIELEPRAPGLFHLAFEKRIRLPSADEGWPQLRKRGGIDVGSSHFRMVLANRTSRPITVFNVHAEVLHSKAPPRGTYAWAYSQGDEGLDRLVAFIPEARRGSVGSLYRASEPHQGREELEARRPYFENRYVSLAPGEVFPTVLTIETEVPRTVEYRLVAEGESATSRFVVRSNPQRIVGEVEDPYQQAFARYYQFGHDVTDCTPTPDNPWVDARNTTRSLSCPSGLGHPYEVAPPDEADYPQGNLDLELQVGLDSQSVAISGVEVGAAPAAAPVPGVAKELLKALGAWTRCTVFSPSRSYWSAEWEQWELEVTFTSNRDLSDCTPRSRSHVQEVELRGTGETARTNLGPITLGSGDVPGPLSRVAEPAEAEGDPGFLVPGVMPCDPGRKDAVRTRLVWGESSGILLWYENSATSEVEQVVINLPDEPC
jgi:hypothetical protein